MSNQAIADRVSNLGILGWGHDMSTFDSKKNVPFNAARCKCYIGGVAEGLYLEWDHREWDSYCGGTLLTYLRARKVCANKDWIDTPMLTTRQYNAVAKHILTTYNCENSGEYQFAMVAPRNNLHHCTWGILRAIDRVLSSVSGKKIRARHGSRGNCRIQHVLMKGARNFNNDNICDILLVSMFN